MNKIIAILTLLASAFPVVAQDFKVDSTLKEEYPFINWERNRLDFYGASPAFKKFFARLDSQYRGLTDTTFNIFHIGGSHIQADIYSHRIRRYLQNMSPTMKSGRGVIFPYTVAGTNNPWNYKVDYTGAWDGKRNSVLRDTGTWGMEGITAYTNDSISSIKLTNRKYLKYRYHYNKVKILHNTPGDSVYCIRPVDTSNVKSIITNDSLNYTLVELKKNVEAFEFRIVRMTRDTSKQFMLFGIDLANDDPGVIYHSIGVNGASFATYRRCELFEAQLKQYPPDLFIISVGTNDTYKKDFDTTQYENYYEDFLKMILHANPNAAIALTVPNDSYYRRRYPNPHTVKAARAIERLAKKYDMCVWNFYEIMGGKGSSQYWYRNNLMPRDRIHFTAKGYDIKADLFTVALFEAWDKFMERDTHHLYHKHIDPDSTINHYAERANEWDPDDPGNAKFHIVSSGESLGVIANRYGCSVADIMAWNGMRSTVIYPGQQLKLFVSGPVNTPPQKKKEVKKALPPKQTSKGSGEYYYYTIRSGDTLWDIANDKNTSVESIQALNPNLNPSDLKVGQRIKIEK